MRVLFIGGTGNISADCTLEALSQGIEVFHLNRGNHPPVRNVTTIEADINDTATVKKKLEGYHFDAVVDWIAFTPEHIARDLDLFKDRIGQYIFISSASAYKKPTTKHFISESTPLLNPFWEYSRNKAACEELLMHEYKEKGFPVTIVRPSHTYSIGWLPSTMGSRGYTVAQRILDKKEIIVHDSGQSLWTLTHTKDFAVGFTGLLGNHGAVGEAFHITSDNAYTWDEIHNTIAMLLGTAPRIVHIPSDFIASQNKDIGAGLLGDKRYSMMFDNSKIKQFVPGFSCTISLRQGIQWSLDWFNKHPEMKGADQSKDQLIDSLIGSWREQAPWAG